MTENFPALVKRYTVILIIFFFAQMGANMLVPYLATAIAQPTFGWTMYYQIPSFVLNGITAFVILSDMTKNQTRNRAILGLTFFSAPIGVCAFLIYSLYKMEFSQETMTDL